MEKFFGLGSAILDEHDLDTSKRKEKIVVLPENTLRFTDFPLYLNIAHIIGKPINEDLENLLYHLVCRTDKDLGKFFDVDQSVVDTIFKKEYKKYWDLAPRTEFYGMLEPLTHQSFLQSINILFPEDGVIETSFTDKIVFDKYDGSFDALVEYLSESNFTCLVISDMDLLLRLVETHKIDFNSKSILVSRIGHNFTYENNYLELRNESKINEEFFLEIRSVDLFKFTKQKEEPTNDGK